MKNRIHSWLVIAALGGMVFAPWSDAQAANSIFLKPTKTQGGLDLKGSVTRKGFEGALPVISFTHEIVSPRDSASGQATGKRQHMPIRVRMYYDQSLPMLYTAMFKDTVLPELVISVFDSSVKGSKEPAHTVTLTNAVITEIRVVNPKDGEQAVEVAFTYQKIEFTWKEGNISAVDDWHTHNVKPAPAPKPMPKPLPKQ
jgi:type VI secretion system secreted protein Hcp